MRLSSQEIEAVEDVGELTAGGGEQVVDFADTAAEHCGDVSVAEFVAVGEHQDLLLCGIELGERAFEV